MKISGSKGFTIAEILVASFVTMFAVIGCWSIYVMGYDFYQRSLHHITVQKTARLAVESMLYGYGGSGLLRAKAINDISDTSIDFDTADNAGCQIYLDTSKKQILYTQPGMENPVEFTPEYIQANGGIAVTGFGISSPDGKRVDINIEVSSFEKGTDPDNYQDEDLKGVITLSSSVKGRLL